MTYGSMGGYSTGPRTTVLQSADLGYALGATGRLVGFELETGKVRWEAPKGLGRATFVYHQGHFIAVGERGDLALIEVSPDGYKEKRKVRVLDYPCWTPPVISDGRLFLRNEKTLVCFDLRKP